MRPEVLAPVQVLSCICTTTIRAAQVGQHALQPRREWCRIDHSRLSATFGRLRAGATFEVHRLALPAKLAPPGLCAAASLRAAKGEGNERRMRRLVLRITRRLVLVPLLYVGWRLVVLGRKMGIGASLPDRVIRAIDFNDVKALDDVRPAAPAAPAAARALARAAAFGLTGAGAARADAGSLPAAGRAAAAGDAGHGPRPPAVVAAHVRGRQRLLRLRRRGALPGRRQALAVPASWGGKSGCASMVCFRQRLAARVRAAAVWTAPRPPAVFA